MHMKIIIVFGHGFMCTAAWSVITPGLK